MGETKDIFRIGIISDTHIRRLPFVLPEKLYKVFGEVDMILHAGDIQSDEVIMELATFAPVYAVAGNCDGWDLVHSLGRKRVIDVRGLKIGLTHGTSRGENAWLAAYREFTEVHSEIVSIGKPKLDCLVYGHTHVPQIIRKNGMLIVNPGSAVDKRNQPHTTVAILEICEGKAEAYIVELD